VPKVNFFGFIFLKKLFQNSKNVYLGLVL